MNKIVFYTWQTLWNATPTAVVTITDTQGILNYKNYGIAVSDLYFNDADYPYWDITLDLSAIQSYIYPLINTAGASQYVPYVPSFYDTYQALWRLGVRLYRDDELLFTGLVFADSIKINDYESTFSFTASSILGTYKKIVPNMDIIPGSSLYETHSIADQIESLYSYCRFMLTSTAYSRPTLTPNTVAITLPDGEIEYSLPQYNNDFSEWESGNGNLTDSHLIHNIISIGNYPNVSDGGTNTNITIFMIKAWQRFASGLWLSAFKMKAYSINIFSPLTPTLLFDVAQTNIMSGGSEYLYAAISSILPNYVSWLVTTPQSSFTVTSLGITYTISEDDDQWIYSGDYLVSELELNEDVKQLNPFAEIESLAYLKQSMMVNDAYGNIYMQSRPPLADTTAVTTISNEIIGTPQKSGMLMKEMDFASEYEKFNGSENLIKFGQRYVSKIRGKYRVKLALTYDGDVTANLSDKIRYSGNNYYITAIIPDYLNYQTNIEAYGEL